MNLIYYSKKVDIYFSLFIFSVVTCILPKLVLVGLSLLVIGYQIVADAVIWKKTSFFFFLPVLVVPAVVGTTVDSADKTIEV